MHDVDSEMVGGSSIKMSLYVGLRVIKYGVKDPID